MKIKLGILFILCFNSFAQEWVLLRKLDKTKLWKVTGVENVFGAITESQISKKSQELSSFEQFQEEKKKSLSYMGISNWNVDNHFIKKEKKGTSLFVRGTYQDSLGQKTLFAEKHIFKKNKVIRYTYTQIDNGKKIREDLLETFLLL